MSSAGDEEEDGINLEDGSNLELGPVLSVLTEEQKNLLLCQAIQKDPSLAELVLLKAAEPISPEDAASRVEALDAAAAVQAVRSFLAIDGAELNALTMLVALTDAVREAFVELAGLGADWPDSDELEAVEALPPASTISALWSTVLGAKAVVVEGGQAAELRELLEETKAAAAGVKKVLPALLIGPEGAFDNFATSLALLPKPQAASNASRKKPRSK